jgi:hypothetical protein
LATSAIAIAARLYGLGQQSLWIDEAYSANFARLPFAQMIEKLGREATPPLYYLLLRGWTALLGTSEAALRSLSAALSLTQLALLVHFTARRFSLRTASVLGALLVWLPIHVYYAQEARMYSLLALVATLQLVLAARALERPSTPVLLACGLASLLSLWTHNVALWLVAGVNLGFLITSRERRVRLRWLAAQALAALAYLPWGAVALGQLRSQRDVLEWFVPFWNAKSPLGHLVDSAASFTLGPYPPYLALPTALPLAWVIAAAAIAGASYGAVRAWSSREARLATIALVTALVLSLGYSLLVQPIHIPGRTDQALRPFFLLLLALGLAALRPKWIGNVLVGLFAIGALATLVPYYGNPAKSESRGWLSALRERVQPGDAVVATGLTFSETKYYLARWQRPAQVRSFPLRVAGHPGYVNYEELRGEPGALQSDANELAALFERTLALGGRGITLLTPPADVNAVLVSTLERRLGVRGTDVGGSRQSLLGTPVRVVLFER